MHPQSISFIIACFLANRLVATPLAAPDAGDLVLNHVEDSKNGGVLEYYKGPDESKNRRTEDLVGGLQERGWPFKEKVCKPSDDLDCDDKNGGPNGVCDVLVTELYGNPDRPIEDSDRGVCYRLDSSERCCIKWTQEIKGLKNKDLSDLASHISKTCTADGVSGKYDTKEVKGVCVSICMNNNHKCSHAAKKE